MSKKRNIRKACGLASLGLGKYFWVSAPNRKQSIHQIFKPEQKQGIPVCTLTQKSRHPLRSCHAFRFKLQTYISSYFLLRSVPDARPTQTAAFSSGGCRVASPKKVLFIVASGR